MKIISTNGKTYEYDYMRVTFHMRPELAKRWNQMREELEELNQTRMNNAQIIAYLIRLHESSMDDCIHSTTLEEYES